MKLSVAVLMISMLLTSVPVQNAGTALPLKPDQHSTYPPEPSQPVEITMYFYGCGDINATDNDAVVDAVNQYLKKKGLNMTFNPIWGSWYEDHAIPLDEIRPADIYFTSSWTRTDYNSYARNGKWLRLDAPVNNLLNDFGQDIRNELPPALIESVSIIGQDGYGIYALPAFNIYGKFPAWDVNTDLLKKYGYTLDDIKNTDYYGFGEILKTVKKGEGEDFYPLATDKYTLEEIVTGSTSISNKNSYQPFLSYYFDLQNVSSPAGDGKIKNKYATEEYRKFMEKTHEYYLAGYIDPAAGTEYYENDLSYFNDSEYKKYFIRATYADIPPYGWQMEDTGNSLTDIIPACAPYVNSMYAQSSMMAISSLSMHPEHAMTFLNLLNTDPYLMTLLCYGVEDMHYIWKNDEIFPVITDDYHWWTWKNGIGNTTLLPKHPDEAAGEEIKKYHAQARPLAIAGYYFDETNVSEESLACKMLVYEYASAFNAGRKDPEELQTFLELLEAAGINKVVEEANNQLSEFLLIKKEHYPNIILEAEKPDSAEVSGDKATPDYEVLKGDCLWSIARDHLGDGRRYIEIYERNRPLIDSYNAEYQMPQYTIYPGQLFILPTE